MEKSEKLKLAKKKLQEFKLSKNKKKIPDNEKSHLVEHADSFSIESDTGTASVSGLDQKSEISEELPKSSGQDSVTIASKDRTIVLEMMLGFKDSELQEAQNRIEELENLLKAKEDQLKTQVSSQLSPNIIDTVKVVAQEVYHNIREVVQEVVEEDQEDFSEEQEETTIQPSEQSQMTFAVEEKKAETVYEEPPVQSEGVTEMETETLINCLKLNNEEISQLKNTISTLQSDHLEEMRNLKAVSDHQETLLRSKIKRLEQELALSRIVKGIVPYNVDNMEESTEINLKVASDSKEKADMSLVHTNVDLLKKLQLLYSMFNINEPHSLSTFEKLLETLNEIMKEWYKYKSDLEEAHKVIEMQHLKIIEALDKQESQKVSRLSMIKAASMEFVDGGSLLDKILADLNQVQNKEDPIIQNIIREVENLNQLFTQLKLKLTAKSDRLDFQLALNAEMKKLFITNALASSPTDTPDFNIIGRFNEAKIEIGRLQELLISNDISY
ncbi:hypothetical protein HDV06_002840 [Boothiomyces sp. JEL0866]|nr:hypothetical protein HDV06_002840 [Boothiomyces sp. JEL0866]